MDAKADRGTNELRASIFVRIRKALNLNDAEARPLKPGRNVHRGYTECKAVRGWQSAWCKTTEYTTPTGLTRFRDDERATVVSLVDPAKGEYSMYLWFAVYPSLEAAVETYVDLLTVSMRYHLRGRHIRQGWRRGQVSPGRVCGRLRYRSSFQSGTRDRAPSRTLCTRSRWRTRGNS